MCVYIYIYIYIYMCVCVCVCVCVISCVYLLSVTVENNSSKDMGRVIAEFMQTVEFYANNEKRETTIVFRTLQGSPLERVRNYFKI